MAPRQIRSTLEKKIASEIRHYRNKANLSVHDLAERIGCSCVQLLRYEHGVNPVPASILIIIACELNVPLDLLVKTALSLSKTGDSTSDDDDSTLSHAPYVNAVA